MWYPKANSSLLLSLSKTWEEEKVNGLQVGSQKEIKSMVWGEVRFLEFNLIFLLVSTPVQVQVFNRSLFSELQEPSDVQQRHNDSWNEIGKEPNGHHFGTLSLIFD